MTRHIAVLTGKRGGYGAMKPMLRAIDRHPSMRLSLIVTDQHVNPAFGATASEIARDFEVAASVDMEQASGAAADRVRALGVCLQKMAGALESLAPDAIVLYGDRGEVLATAIAALNLRIPSAHIQGGDVSGNVDEPMRHAITKLSHLHFPATEAAAERIRRMGEEAWRVHVAGDNHVDPIVAGDYTEPAAVRKKFGVGTDERPIIVLQHPETIRRRDHGADMRATLEAVLARGQRTLAVYPCSDQGFEEVIRAIESYRGHPKVSIHTNIDAPDFHGLMAIASVFVGNSSAGLIETPYFPVAAINVGERQKGRLHAENVIHCEFGRDNVAAALRRALDDAAFAATVTACSKPFGDGQAWRRIVSVLERTNFDAALLEKRMTY